MRQLDEAVTLIYTLLAFGLGIAMIVIMLAFLPKPRCDEVRAVVIGSVWVQGGCLK